MGTEAVEMLREMREEQQRLRDEVMQLRREASEERAELAHLRARAGGADVSPRSHLHAGAGAGVGVGAGAGPGASFDVSAGGIPKAHGGLLNKRHPTGNVRAVVEHPTPR